MGKIGRGLRLLEVTTVEITMSSFLQPLIAAAKEAGFEVWTACRLDNPTENPLPSFGADKSVQVRFSRRLFAADNLRAWHSMRHLLATERFDLIHVHTPVAAFVTRLAAATLPGRRPLLIYTAHGLHFQQSSPLFQKVAFILAEKLAARWTDIIVVMNDEDEYAARRHRLGSRVARIDGVGVDTDFYDASRFTAEKRTAWRRENGIPAESQIITMIAEMIPRKRHIDAIKAFPAVLRTHSKAILLFVGDGPLRPSLERVVVRNGLDKAIHFMGWRSDIAEILSQTDILLHPAVQEGLPRVIMEAMSMQVPVVGVDVRGCRDLLREGAGMVAKPRNPASLAEAVLHLLLNPHEGRKMGKAGRDKVLGRYALPQVLAAYMHLFTKFLEVRKLNLG